MVPAAEFSSYYGRPVVKPSPWEADIPLYLFAGGLAAGSSLLAAGADLSGRPALRRNARLAGLAGISASLVVLVHDLGRPSRFLNMLRTIKVTSPMSVGTWLLMGYGPFAGLAAVAEVLPARGPFKILPYLARPAGLVAAGFAPAVASYTGVLLSDTASPSWHEAFRELPFVFVGSAAVASGGVAMIATPVAEAGPARRLAAGGAALELLADQRMQSSMGLAAEPLHQGKAGKWMRASTVLTLAGAAGSLLAGRSRGLSVISGAALAAGSLCTRFGIFAAGQASARDPKYTVIPQRERVDAGHARPRTPAP